VDSSRKIVATIEAYYHAMANGKLIVTGYEL
jgi:hypothetical protein